MWKKRLAIYDPDPPSTSGRVEKGVCVDTGVPKAMGVARCAATGLYTYYLADGHKLKEHPDCPGLYYCEVRSVDDGSLSGELVSQYLMSTR